MTSRLIVLCVTASLAGCAALRPEQPPQTSPDGLQLISSTSFELAYARPDRDLSSYQAIVIRPPVIEFERGWQASQNLADPNRVTQRDIERIKRIMGAHVQDVMAAELSASGDYQIANAAGPGNIELQAYILDLYLSAPAAAEAYQVTVLSQTAGRMKIVLEVYDSNTNELLLRVSDEGSARDFPNFRRQEIVNNRYESSRLLKAWAQSLTSVLKETSG